MERNVCEESHLTVDEVAEILKVPRSWVYGHMREASKDQIPGFRVGKFGLTPGAVVELTLWLVVSLALKLYLHFFDRYSASIAWSGHRAHAVVLLNGSICPDGRRN
jgi:hypothetical protein